MSTKENGGPAFPGHDSVSGVYLHQGMTLRDYFAVKAMVGLMQMISTRAHAVSASDPAADLSAQAYAQADAMLKAREA